MAQGLKYRGRYVVADKACGAPFASTTNDPRPESLTDALEVFAKHNILAIPVRDPEATNWMGFVDVLVRSSLPCFQRPKLMVNGNPPLPPPAGCPVLRAQDVHLGV